MKITSLVKDFYKAVTDWIAEEPNGPYAPNSFIRGELEKKGFTFHREVATMAGVMHHGGMVVYNRVQGPKGEAVDYFSGDNEASRTYRLAYDEAKALYKAQKEAAKAAGPSPKP